MPTRVKLHILINIYLYLQIQLINLNKMNMPVILHLNRFVIKNLLFFAFFKIMHCHIEIKFGYSSLDFLNELRLVDKIISER